MAQQPDRPLMLPKSDVAVTYQFEATVENGPRKLQVTYTKGGERVRIDYFRWVEAKYPYLGVIFDRPANRLISLEPERKAYIERPVGNTTNPGAFLSPNMVLTRLGSSTVAFAPCAEWKFEVPGENGGQGTACVTDDGILLRLASTSPSVASLTATSVRYGSPPDGVFGPPAGFHSEPLPGP